MGNLDARPRKRYGEAFQTRGANRLQRKSRLRNQTSFNPALGSDEHDFSFRSSRHPFAGNSQRGENVPARAASRNQQLQISLPRFRHMELKAASSFVDKSLRRSRRAGVSPAFLRHREAAPEPARRRRYENSFFAYQSACWLIFRSTPVAASITRRLEPP